MVHQLAQADILRFRGLFPNTGCQGISSDIWTHCNVFLSVSAVCEINNGHTCLLVLIMCCARDVGKNKVQIILVQKAENPVVVMNMVHT